MHSNNTYELYHFGIKGQKWGIRRYQNEDGSLTEAGRKRYSRLQQKIDKIEARRAHNKETYKALVKEGPFLSKGFTKARYDVSEVHNKYKIAKLKAKQDESYKNSPEYLKAKGEHTREIANRLLYGKWGAIRYRELTSKGYDSRTADMMTRGERAMRGMILDVVLSSLK